MNVKMAAIRNAQCAIRNAGLEYAIRKMLKKPQLLNTLRMAYLTLMRSHTQGPANSPRNSRVACQANQGPNVGRMHKGTRLIWTAPTPSCTSANIFRIGSFIEAEVNEDF